LVAVTVTVAVLFAPARLRGEVAVSLDPLPGRRLLDAALLPGLPGRAERVALVPAGDPALLPTGRSTLVEVSQFALSLP
jgi:hypothetical protein